MTAQQLSFEAPVARARTTDLKTSHDAARIATKRLPSRRARIVEILKAHELCDDELCEAMGEPLRSWPSVKSARSGLHTDGFVEPCGERHPFGDVERVKQTVWRLVLIARVEVNGDVL